MIQGLRNQTSSSSGVLEGIVAEHHRSESRQIVQAESGCFQDVDFDIDSGWIIF